MKYIIITLFLIAFNSSNAQTSNTDFYQKKAIIVYGSDTCHYCTDTKVYLKERQVSFIYYDVDVNLEKQREMLIKLQKAGFSVDSLSLPVVDLNGKLIMNDAANFEEFLKKLITNKK